MDVGQKEDYPEDQFLKTRKAKAWKEMPDDTGDLKE